MSTDTYSYSHDGEMFTIDEFPSRELALAAAIREVSPGDKVYTGLRQDPPHANDFVPNASELLESIGECAYEEHDEHAEDWPNIADKAQLEQIQMHLDAIGELVHSFDKPTFYYIVDIESHVVPEA